MVKYSVMIVAVGLVVCSGLGAYRRSTMRRGRSSDLQTPLIVSPPRSDSGDVFEFVTNAQSVSSQNLKNHSPSHESPVDVEDMEYGFTNPNLKRLRESMKQSVPVIKTTVSD